MLEQLKNIKTTHKILAITFLLLFFALIFFHIKYNVGLFFDQPANFTAIISHSDENLNGYKLLHIERVRFFSVFFVSVLFNLFFLIYRSIVDNFNIVTTVSFYTASFYIIHILGILMNFIVAYRTKRYDIAVIGLLFYCLFCMPNLLWAIREINVAVLFYFALLSYFLSETKLTKLDILPISLILLYLFESVEQTIIFALLLNIFACLYTVYKKDENLGFKNYIGTISFIIILYIPVKLFLCYSNHLSGGVEEYLFSIRWYFTTMPRSITLLSALSLPMIIFCCFYKKLFGFKSFLCILIYYILCALYITNKNHFIHDGTDETSFYAGVMLFIFPAIFIVLAMDFFNININKFNKVLVSNLFIIACVIGIFHLVWQIHGCFEFNKYTTYLKNLIKESNEKIIEIPQSDFASVPYLKFYMPYGIIHQSIFLNELPDVKTIIIPFKFAGLEKDWMADRNTNINNDIFLIHTSSFSNRHNKYINVSEISKYIEDQKKNHNLESYYDKK